MSAALTLHIVRHGEVYNPEKILYGRLPGFRLSETGQQQAIAAGAALRNEPLAALYASPMQRAQETAGYIAAAREIVLPVQTHDALNEVFSPSEGQLLAELEKTSFDIYSGNESPYELVRDLRRRLSLFVHEMRQTHQGQTITAVTHGDMLVSAFMIAMRQDENDIGRNRLEALGLTERYPATASIMTLIYQTTDLDEIPQYRYLRPY